MTDPAYETFRRNPQLAVLPYPTEKYKNSETRVSWDGVRKRARDLHLPMCTNSSPKSGLTLWNNIKDWVKSEQYRQETDRLYNSQDQRERFPLYNCSGKPPTDEQAQTAVNTGISLCKREDGPFESADRLQAKSYMNIRDLDYHDCLPNDPDERIRYHDDLVSRAKGKVSLAAKSGSRRSDQTVANLLRKVEAQERPAEIIEYTPKTQEFIRRSYSETGPSAKVKSPRIKKEYQPYVR